jgi:hypothetical protein
VDRRLDIAKRVMGIVRGKAVQRRDAIQLEAHAAIGIHRPVKQIGLAIPDRIERGQDIEPGVAIELGGEDVGLQVLVEGLAQHLLVELDAVEPRPDRRATSVRSARDLLGELEERRQRRIHQLRWAHPGDRQRPRRGDDVRRDAATQIDPLDLPEFAIRQNGRELQGLIEGGRDAGGFEIVEGEFHDRKDLRDRRDRAGAGALTELLGSALDAARIARENRKKRGSAFLQTLGDAVALASGQGRLSPFHRLLLASAWTRNGLAAPASLELSATDIDASGLAPGIPDRTEADALLDDLFQNLIEQTEGDALALHAALTETFPAMPPEMRWHVIRVSTERAEPIHARLTCFWLLDRDAAIRIAAARALADRAASGALTAELAGRIVVLRNWMPPDEARGLVDKAVKLSMRSGLTAGVTPAPWTTHSVMATLPDGGGAQSIAISLQSGGRRMVAMLLLKQGHGVKDAYTIACNSASEQKALIQRVRDEAGAVSVPASWMERALSVALADGLAAGLPPAPGLVEDSGTLRARPAARRSCHDRGAD